MGSLFWGRSCGIFRPGLRSLIFRWRMESCCRRWAVSNWTRSTGCVPASSILNRSASPKSGFILPSHGHAILVTILVTALATTVIRRYRIHPRLLRLAILLLVLLIAQLTLGVLTVLLRKPADVASAHVAIGAAVLVTTFILTVRAARIFGLARGDAGFAKEPF